MSLLSLTGPLGAGPPASPAGGLRYIYIEWLYLPLPRYRYRLVLACGKGLAEGASARALKTRLRRTMDPEPGSFFNHRKGMVTTMAKRLSGQEMLARIDAQREAALAKIEREKIGPNPNVSTLEDAYKAIGYVRNRVTDPESPGFRPGLQEAVLVCLQRAQDELAAGLKSYGAPPPKMRERKGAVAQAS